MTGEEIRLKREGLGLSQDALAREVGTTQQTIQRIEKDITKSSMYKDLVVDFLSGNPTGKADWALRLEERSKRFRGHEQSSAAMHSADSGKLVNRQNTNYNNEYIPVYSTKLEENGYLEIDQVPLRTILRPDPLLNAPDGYGLYIADDTMSPAIKSGEIALAHPRLPPLIGEDHVFRGGPFEDAEEICVIRKLVGVTPFIFSIEQYNPSEKSELGRSLFLNCHRIVGKFTRW